MSFLPDFIVLSRDEHTLVTYKPKGMSCEFQQDINGISLLEQAKKMIGGDTARIRLPHRIDRVTQGIVMLALSDEAIRFYNLEIKEKRWQKYYIARVHAHPDKEMASFSGHHKAYILEEKGRARCVFSGGKPSFLNILAIEPAISRENEYHVLIELLTGRFHQIRAMLSHLGIPLAGDQLYGSSLAWDDFYLEHALLKYTDFATREQCCAMVQHNSAVEPVAPEILAMLKKISDTQVFSE